MIVRVHGYHVSIFAKPELVELCKNWWAYCRGYQAVTTFNEMGLHIVNTLGLAEQLEILVIAGHGSKGVQWIGVERLCRDSIPSFTRVLQDVQRICKRAFQRLLTIQLEGCEVGANLGFVRELVVALEDGLGVRVVVEAAEGVQHFETPGYEDTSVVVSRSSFVRRTSPSFFAKQIGKAGRSTTGPVQRFGG